MASLRASSHAPPRAKYQERKNHNQEEITKRQGSRTKNQEPKQKPKAKNKKLKKN
jgi:hypothetical protein